MRNAEFCTCGPENHRQNWGGLDIKKSGDRDKVTTPKNRKIAYIQIMAKNTTKPDRDSDTNVITKTRPKTQKPALYKVLLLNDDFTPMEFVVHILELFFNKSGEDAYTVMLHV